MAKKRRSLEEQIEHAKAMLLLAFEIWEYIRTKGCHDPFYPDGENMNLERQHILSYKMDLEKLCEGRVLPDEYYIQTPEEVDPKYMAPHGVHYERRMKGGMADMYPLTYKVPEEIENQQELF